MIFRQFMLDDLQSAAYLVGDADAGSAAVVDPHLNVGDYLDAAAMYGVTIDHVLETHTHADRVSGHGLLAARGATIHVNSIAKAEYPHNPIDDGWSLRLGSVELRAMHTPGHRPEHTAFVVVDHARGPEPWAVLTGDSLFVSDIGRPDLAVEATQGARDLFRSLHDGLLTLPPTTEVWPGHTGGSLCGSPGMDLKTSSTIGFERAHNPLLQEADEERFVEAMTTDLPPQPANLQNIVSRNRGPLITEVVEPEALGISRFQERVETGALVLDVRDSVEYDAVHIRGSLWIPVARAGFANRVAELAAADDQIVIVGEGDRDARRAAELAPSVGIDGVLGFLSGGFDAWPAAGHPTTEIERVPAGELFSRLETDTKRRLIDVRRPDEIEHDAPEDLIARPLNELRHAELPVAASEPVAVVCATGLRAGIGGSLLEWRGFSDVVHVAEGGLPELIDARRSVAS